MVPSDPLNFELTPGAGDLRLEDVLLQRVFETDTAGRTTIDARLEAKVVAPEGDYVTATIDLVFALFHGDSQVGSCEARGIVFDGRGERTPVCIETDAVRLGLGADVTAIDVFVDRTVIVNAESKARLERA